MTPTTARRRLGAIAGALAALLVGALLTLAPALPAAAHDALVTSDPAADTVVDSLPAAITLTFTADLLAEPGAAQVQATDAAGTALVSGDVVVSGPTVTAPLAGDASGAVTVLWRAVSSDGHPISGEFAFTVASATASESPEPSASTTAPSATTPAASADPEPTATATPVAVPAAAADVAPWAILALVAGAASLAVVVAVLVGRRRRAGGDPSSSR